MNSVQERRTRIIEALREVAARLGPNVTIARFYKETGITDAAIYRVFENWAAARVAAGLPAEVERGRCRHSREGLLQQLTELANEVGEQVSYAEFLSRTGVSQAPINRLFGSWTAFKAAAGLFAVRKPGSRARFTKEEILEHLQRLVDERGDITQVAFCQELGISTRTLIRFGNWTQLRRELNLPRRAKTGRPRWLTKLVSDIPDPAELLDDD